MLYRKIAAVIVIVMLCGLLVVPASAADSGSISLGSASGGRGDTVTLNVNLDSNPGLVTMTIRVSYDTSVLQLIHVSDPGLLVGSQLNSSYGSPYTISWVDGATATNNTKTGTIATFTFQILDNAPLGDSTVRLQFMDSYDTDYQENSFSSYSGKVTVTCKDSESHIWDSGTVTQEPTCMEEGVMTYTCTVCGATKPEPIAKTKLRLSGTSMTLGDSLSVDFVIDINCLGTESAYATVTKTYADGRAPVSVKIPREDWKHHSGDLYYFSFHGVAAKEMCDTLTAEVFDAEGEAISVPYTDSIRDYAMRMLGKDEVTENAALRTLYVDMLNYGAAAQVQFAYDTENLANSHLTETQKAWATPDYETANGLVEGPGRTGTTLTLKSRITLDFLFSKDALTEGCYAIATYTDHYGNAVEQRIERFYDYDALRSYVSVPGLAVADYGTLVTCTVYNAEGAAIAWATDSMEGYAHRMADKLPAMLEALMKFGSSAYRYFHP